MQDMQLGIYVNKEHEPNARRIKDIAAVEGRTVTSVVHEAIDFYLIARWSLVDAQEEAERRGISASALVKEAVEHYLTINQEV